MIQLFRQLGLAQAIDAEVAVKQRQHWPAPTDWYTPMLVSSSG
jgi:hypothetical protein